MSRVCWWLVDLTSRMLDADEREAVLGDISECAESGGKALRDVLGLVIRRQAAPWRDFRPWLALIGFIVPFALALSIVSRLIAQETAVYTWLYANNWDWSLVRNRGFWYVFVDSANFVLTRWLILACWAWTVGFVLGSTSRRGPLLMGLTLVLGALIGASQYLAFYSQYLHTLFGFPRFPTRNGHEQVFALTFYRVVFPLIVQLVLVVIPSLWAIRQRANLARVPAVLRTVVWMAAIATLAGMLIEVPGFLLFLFKVSGFWIWRAHQPRVLHLVVFWPIVYVLAQASGLLWHQNKMVPA